MVKVWVLFVWLGVAQPWALATFTNEKDCLSNADTYKKARCVQLQVEISR